MKAIVNTKLILEDGIIFDGTLLTDGERIAEVGRACDVTVPDGAEIIDAHGKYTAPGLIDIHNHGSSEHLFADDPLACCEHFILHGQTTVLPTFYQTLTAERMAKGAAMIREASKKGVGRIMDGLYMEGPYMSCNDSQKEEIVWTGDIKAEDYIPLADALGDMVRVWAIDPARPKIDEFMEYIKERFPDAIFAIGHSKATAAECRRVKKYGVRVQTHHGDSGRPKGRAQGTPGAGCDVFTLYDPDIYAELICDETGIHVIPDLIKSVVKTKGVERMILITDSMVKLGDYKNDESAGIWFGPDLNYDAMGRLSGSHLTLDCACRNLMTHTGYGLCHAIRFATANPARMLGIDGKVGTLEKGKLANLIIIDDAVNVERVILEGETAVVNGKLV